MTPLSYPPITAPKPFGIDVTDPMAFLISEYAAAVERITTVVGPTGIAAVGILKDSVSLMWVAALVRDPLNGKNQQRVAELQGYYSAGDVSSIIGRYNAEPLEPDWMRCVCMLLAVLLGVPLAAFG